MSPLARSIALLCRCILAMVVLLAVPVHAQQDAAAPAGDGAADAQVMHVFTQHEQEKDRALAVSERQKHQILFFMGAALLIFLLATAALGVAMVIYGKPVFVAHMIFAGFSVTLAIVHAVVAVVWFFPFSSP